MAETQEMLITGGSNYAIYGRQILSDITVEVDPVYDSQALHPYGYTTTIGVSSSVMTGSDASVSLTAGVNAVYATLSATMQVSNSVSYTTGSSVSYTISASTASGRYRIEHVFPREQVIQQQVLYDYSGQTIQWQRTILCAPRSYDAYRRLNRYANP